MKRCILCLLGLVLLLSACGGRRQEPAPGEKYTPTAEETVAADQGYHAARPEADPLMAVCQSSAVIVKAVYLGYREFSGMVRVHLFSPEEEYTHRLREQIIHVYESRETSFISGKTYYLFLTGFLSGFYPHPVYSRCGPEYLIGEDGNGYTFYGGRTLGLDAAGDLGRYLREEIVEKGYYDRDAAALLPESLEDACEGADVILTAAVLEAEDTPGGNPYIRYARYSVDRVLKGERLYADLTGAARTSSDADVTAAAGKGAPLMQAPADTAAGDRFILLFRADPDTGMLDMYSLQHSCLRVESEEGQWVLARFPADG